MNSLNLLSFIQFFKIIFQYIFSLPGFISGAFGSFVAPWAHWRLKERTERRKRRGNFILNIKNELMEAMSSYGPSPSCCKIFGYVTDELSVYFTRKEKNAWIKFESNLKKIIQKSDNFKNPYDYNQYIEICTETYKFLYEVIKRLEIKWELI